MPLVLNVGFTRKHGLPDYGSVGASCNVQFELDASLIKNDLESFHRHVRNAYVACNQAVNDELSRHKTEPANRVNGTASENRNGVRDHSGNGSNHASSKQIEYMRQLARQVRGVGIRGLDSLAEHLHGKPVDKLSSLDASALIDTLKAGKEGRIDLSSILEGVSA